MATLAVTLPKSDASIREDVVYELKYDPKITSSDIAIAVKDGVVTLSGYVSSYRRRTPPRKPSNGFMA